MKEENSSFNKIKKLLRSDQRPCIFEEMIPLSQEEKDEILDTIEKISSGHHPSISPVVELFFSRF